MYGVKILFPPSAALQVLAEQRLHMFKLLQAHMELNLEISFSSSPCSRKCSSSSNSCEDT